MPRVVDGVKKQAKGDRMSKKGNQKVVDGPQNPGKGWLMVSTSKQGAADGPKMARKGWCGGGSEKRQAKQNFENPISCWGLENISIINKNYNVNHQKITLGGFHDPGDND